MVAHTNAELFLFVNEKIGQIPGVRKTVTSVVPMVIKDAHHWHIPPGVVEADRGIDDSGNYV